MKTVSVSSVCLCLIHHLLLHSVWTPCGQAALEWHLVDNGTGIPAPQQRRDAALGYDRALNKLVLFGGRTVQNDASKVLGDTLIYDLATGLWRPTIGSSDEKPEPRFSMVYGSSKHHMYIATGEGPNDIFYDDIWRFDFRTENWSKLPSQSKPSYYSESQWSAREESNIGPSPRYGAAGGMFPNSTRFYVSMGFSERRYGDTYSYSVIDMSWYIVSKDEGPYNPTYPHARCLHAGTMISQDELLIFGGCLSGGHTGGACPAADSWIFNGRDLSWKKQANCASPRTLATMAMLPVVDNQRRVVMYGGEEKGPGRQVLTTIDSPKEQVAIFNPDSGDWTLRDVTGSIPPKKSSVSMVTGSSGIYMFGGYDLQSKKVSNDLHLLLGDASHADLSPVQSDCNPTFFNLIILHGVLMALSWGFFLPWGAFIARYMRHKDPLWFNLHKLFQIFGILLAIAGFICAVISVLKDHFKFTHAIVGLTTMIIGILQPFNALLRPHPPKPEERKTIRRFLWEFIHAFLGRCGIGLGLANISLGVFMAHSHFIIWVTWFAYLGFVLLCNFIAEIAYNRRRLSVKKLNSDVSQAQYIVKDIVPASQLPPEMFENLRRQSQDDKE